jgi:hypothetical protein
VLLIETPFSRPENWLLPVVTDYRLTWFAVALCCVEVLRYRRFISAHSQAPHGSPTLRATAIYLPVFVWGLQAVLTFRNAFGYDTAANISVAGQVAWTMQGWGAMVASLIVLVAILSVCAALQHLAARLVPALRTPVGVPIPVLAGIASVFLFQLSYLLLFLSLLTERRP